MIVGTDTIHAMRELMPVNDFRTELPMDFAKNQAQFYTEACSISALCPTHHSHSPILTQSYKIRKNIRVCALNAMEKHSHCCMCVFVGILFDFEILSKARENED